MCTVVPSLSSRTRGSNPGEAMATTRYVNRVVGLGPTIRTHEWEPAVAQPRRRLRGARGDDGRRLRPLSVGGRLRLGPPPPPLHVLLPRGEEPGHAPPSVAPPPVP